MTELLANALNLVLYGMGSVFVFLTLLVGATMLMSLLVQPGADTRKTDVTEDSEVMQPEILAAIMVAVKQYRSNH